MRLCLNTVVKQTIPLTIDEWAGGGAEQWRDLKLSRGPKYLNRGFSQGGRSFKPGCVNNMQHTHEQHFLLMINFYIDLCFYWSFDWLSFWNWHIGFRSCDSALTFQKCFLSGPCTLYITVVCQFVLIVCDFIRIKLLLIVVLRLECGANCGVAVCTILFDE
jgi:hypothetical protein